MKILRMDNVSLLLATGLAAVAISSWSCSQDVNIKASGKAQVEHVITIEFGVCDTIQNDPVARISCITTLLDILKTSVAASAVKNNTAQ
jgi:hypothetical protein